MNAFLVELRRRNVFRVAAVYAVVAWLLLQMAALLENAIGLPGWFDGFVVALLLIGFPIAMVLAWAFELTPDGFKLTRSVDAGESVSAQTGRKLDYAILAGLGLVGVLIVGQMLMPRGPAAPAAAAATSEEAAPDEASIAVLPFVDLSERGDQEYFADGISEELLNVLAGIDGLKVAGRTSSFAFKGDNRNLREVGRILNVAYILEGSVRTQGQKVRVTAQLIKASDGFHLWSDTYDGNLSDIFAFQDQIAAEIVAQMEGTILGDASAPVRATRTNLDAYGLFLQARELIYSREVDKMERADLLLAEAIELDPNYAPAYAARGKAVILLSNGAGSYGTRPAGEAIALARKLASRALDLDDKLADGYAVMGLVEADSGNPDRAITLLRRAVELNPNSLDARNWLALSLAQSGRLRDVAHQLYELFELDPLYRPGAVNAVQYALLIGELERAEAMIARYEEIDPKSSTLLQMQASLAWDTGQVARAITLAQEDYDDRQDALNATRLATMYIDIGAFERSNTVAISEIYKPYPLLYQHRYDEAIAVSRAILEETPDYAQAYQSLLDSLILARRDAEVIAYYRDTFEDMDDFEARLRPSTVNDPAPFDILAIAARATGDEDIYTEAMQRFRTDIDLTRAGGGDDYTLDLKDARWALISGDTDAGLAYLERGFKRRDFLPLRFYENRAYDAVRDHPRFKAVRAAALERVNEERAKLGLPALGSEG